MPRSQSWAPAGLRWPRWAVLSRLPLVKASADYLPGVETGIRLTIDDAAARYGYLTDLKVSVGDFSEWPGMPPMFVVRDRDGNSLQIVG